MKNPQEIALLPFFKKNYQKNYQEFIKALSRYRTGCKQTDRQQYIM